MKNTHARPIQIVRKELRKQGKTLVRNKNLKGVVFYTVMPEKNKFVDLQQIAKQYDFAL